MSPEDTGDLEAAEKTQFVDSYNELCNTGEQLKHIQKIDKKCESKLGQV